MPTPSRRIIGKVVSVDSISAGGNPRKNNRVAYAGSARYQCPGMGDSVRVGQRQDVRIAVMRCHLSHDEIVRLSSRGKCGGRTRQPDQNNGKSTSEIHFLVRPKMPIVHSSVDNTNTRTTPSPTVTLHPSSLHFNQKTKRIRVTSLLHGRMHPPILSGGPISCRYAIVAQVSSR